MRRLSSYAWLLSKISYATSEVRVSQFDAECLHAQSIDHDNAYDYWADNADSIGIIKNIYRMQSVFTAGGRRLIVNNAVHADLRAAFPDLISRRVRIDRAWNYPFVLGSTEYQSDSAFCPQEFIRGDISKFVNKYACDKPEVELWEIFTYPIDRNKSSFSDIKVIGLIGNKDGRSSDEVSLSSECVEKYNIYISNAFICSHKMYCVLNKYISRSCFWVQRLAL